MRQMANLADLDLRDAAPVEVMRRTVARELQQYLGVARMILAGAVVAAAVPGGPGGIPAGPVASAFSVPASAWPPDSGREGPNEIPAGGGDPADGIAGLSEKVLSLVAARMNGHDPAVIASVAQTVLEESARAGVDPLLVLALIHVESTFKPAARSDHGAVGLMQLKACTMHSVLGRAGVPAADPRDPVANVQAGVRYLGQLLASFDSLDAALMAYNAGPTRIRGHLRAGAVPVRYHAYPRKVKAELAKLRHAIGTGVRRGMVAEAEPLPSKT